MSKALKRPASKDPNENHLSEPDIKRIRSAIALPVRYLGGGASRPGKNISWSVLQLTSEKNGAPRKWPRQNDPIRNIEDVPAEWNWDPNDPDLDPCDIDANVKRCEERIEDGIMPQLFEIRLSTYKMLRAHRDKLIASEKKGLGLDVVKRLDSLKVIEKDLVANGDAWESLPNVRAIIKAYRSGELKWSRDGKATYWSHGKQICEPKIWDYDDIIKVNRAHNGSRGFWVEGVDGPGPAGHFFVWTIRPEPNKLTFQHNVRFEVRVPPRMPGNKGPFWKGWKADFFDDTGSDTATIFEDDLEEIMNLVPEGIDVPFIGDYQSQSIGGIVTNRNVVMQIRILSPGDNPITRWYPVRVTVYPTRHKEVLPHRLSGDWWRYVLYTANVPDNKGFIHASTMKEDLFKSIPDVNYAQARGPKNIPGLGGEGLGSMPQGRIHTNVPEGILRGGTYVPREGIVGGKAPTARPSLYGGDAAADSHSTSGGAAPGRPPPPGGHLVPGVYFPPGTEGRASRPGMVPYGQYQGPWGASLVGPGDTNRTQWPVVAPEIPPGLGGWWLPRQLLYSPSPPGTEGAGPSPRASQMGTRLPSMPGWEYWTPNGIVEGSSSSEGQSPPRTGEPVEMNLAVVPGGSGGTAPPAGPQVVGPNGEIQPEAGWFWVPPGPGQAWPWGWYYRYPESEVAAAQTSAPVEPRGWVPPPWQQGWAPGPNGLTMGWVPSPGSVPAGSSGSIVYGGLGPTAGVSYQTWQQGDASRDQYWNNPYSISHGGGSSDTRQLDPQASTFVPGGQAGTRTLIPRTAEKGTTGITPQLGRLGLAEAEEAPARDWIAEGIPDAALPPEWPTPLEASDTARQSRARRFARRFGRFVHGRKNIVPINPANPPHPPT